MNVFSYSETEISYLKSRDKKLGTAIDRIGQIRREINPDLFSSIVHQIIGQQISMAAQASIWKRLKEQLETVNAETLLALGREKLQTVGTTFRKAEYILDFSEKVHNGSFCIDALNQMDDESVIKALSSLKGIGVWTAEMCLIFCMQRPDVVSFGDLAILRGMRMLYHRQKIDKETFHKYRRRYSPYGTVASLYLWAVAGGAIPDLSDPAHKNRR